MNEPEIDLKNVNVSAALRSLRIWDRGELWKTIVQTLVTPLTLGIFSYFISGKMDNNQKGFIAKLQSQAEGAAASASRQRMQEEQSRNREKLRDATWAKRLWIWDQIAQDLYEIRGYVSAPAGDGERSAESILARKQHSDLIVNAYREFMSENTVKAYAAFMDSVFQLPEFPRDSLRLKTSYRNHRAVKSKASKRLFFYGKDLNAALVQHEKMNVLWESLRQTVSQTIFAPPAVSTP